MAVDDLDPNDEDLSDLFSIQDGEFSIEDIKSRGPNADVNSDETEAEIEPIDVDLDTGLFLLNSSVWIAKGNAENLLASRNPEKALKCLKSEEPNARTFEEYARNDSNYCDTLAAFWEQYAEAERQVGNAAGTEACSQEARIWREKERSLKESQIPPSSANES